MIRITPLQIGIDEVGRGAWAGPIVGAAVWFPHKVNIPKKIYLRDSKVLTKDQRERASMFILQGSIYYIYSISSLMIDSLGIQKSNQILLRKCSNGIVRRIKAVKKSLFVKEQAKIFIDGRKICNIDFPNEYIEKGDSKYQVIAAASIIAKVERDRIMKEFSKKYPNYLFDRHVGYGTKQHQYTLDRYGPCPLHRKSYKPIKKVINRGIELSVL